jgi:hypothetical protein
LPVQVSALIGRFLLSAFPISGFDWPLSAFQHVSFSAFGLVISAFCFPNFWF